MLFNSYQFMIFYPVVFIIYYVIPARCRRFFLLFASYIFYMGWNPGYAILIASSTLATYVSARLIDKQGLKRRKTILILCLVFNFCILFFFKYFNFTVSVFNRVFVKMGLPNMPPLDVLLPVGISFYTFQAVGYMVDVYRNNIKAEKNFITYALFVSFFPQLVAGPIERSKSLLLELNTIEKKKHKELFDIQKITSGLVLMLYGYFLKMVVADRAAILVDKVFSVYWGYSAVELILAAVGFSIQIYCDFFSYSLIAVGVGKTLGIKLMENFNAPYFSKSIKEFWRRWHISLSSWFRDYLYIPLGGKLHRKRNLIITFLLSGLWHGASFNFIIWGGVHGLYQIIGEITLPWKEKIKNKYQIKENCFSYKLGQIIITYSLTVIAWIFFRLESVLAGLNYLYRMFTRWQLWKLFDGTIYKLGLNRTEMNILIIGIVIVFLVDVIRLKFNQTIDEFLENQNLWFRWLIIFCFVFMVFIYGVYGPDVSPQTFIYFQF